MRIKLWRLLSVGLLLASVAVPLHAHGGTYRGPGSTVGPGGATGGGPSSTSGGATDSDPATWERWWSLNRDSYLQLKRALDRGMVLTGSEDPYLGAGQRVRPPGSSLPSEAKIQSDVVPALLTLLNKADDIDVISGTMLALGKIGVPRVMQSSDKISPALQAFLAHKNQEVHESAAIALGVLADSRNAPLLANLMLDSSVAQAQCKRGRIPHRTRAFAAYGLGLIGYRATREDVRRYVVHQLIKALELGKQPTPDLRAACVIALGLIPLEDADAPPADGSPHPGVSRQGQIVYLLDLFTNKREAQRVRAHIPVALARLERDSDPSSKQLLASVLCKAVAPRSKEVKVVWQGVVQALGILGDADADPADASIRQTLMNVVAGNDRLARHLALIALARGAARIGGGAQGPGLTEVRSFLLQRLSTGNTAMRPWAGLALGVMERQRSRDGEIPDDSVILALRAALGAVRGPQAGAYCLALGLVGDLDSEQDILKRALTGDENLRAHAATSLGLMRSRKSIESLQSVLVGARLALRPGVMRETAIALGLLGSKNALPLLLERLRDSKRMLNQVCLAAAIGFIGDSRAVDPLLEIIASRRVSETTQAYSAVALGIVCDKEALPWNSKLAHESSWWQAPVTLLDPMAGKGILDML